MGITQQIGASSLIKPGVVDSAAARPASPYEGQVIFQKDTDQLLVWNGTAWVIPNQTTQNPEGLELIKVQTIGTAVSSIVVTDVFSATYDNYLIKVNGTTLNFSSDQDYRVKLGSAADSYKSQLIYNGFASSAAGAAITAAVEFYWVGVGAANTKTSYSFELQDPFIAMPTRLNNASYVNEGAGGSTHGIHTGSISFTSFTVRPASGTTTGGTISVYGYRK